MGKGLGCLALLALVAWIGVELIVFYEATVWMNRHWESAIGSGGWIICVVWTVAALVVGIKLGKWHAARIMGGLLNGTAGRHVLGLIGAALLAIPGLISDVFGVLLLLPVVQRLFSKVGAAVVAAVVKRTMGKMMGGGGMAGFGGMGGMQFPGGGFPGGPFPGMKPMTPDDRARFPKPAKTIDVAPEKD